MLEIPLPQRGLPNGHLERCLARHNSLARVVGVNKVAQLRLKVHTV